MNQTCKVSTVITYERRRHARRTTGDFALVRMGDYYGQADIADVSPGGLALVRCTLYDQGMAVYWAIRRGTALYLSLRGAPITVWGTVLRQDPDVRTLAMRVDHCTDMDAWQAYCAAGVSEPKSAA